MKPEHDHVIEYKHFPHYWPFVLGIIRSVVDFLHKGQWHRAVFPKSCQHVCFVRRRIQMSDVGFVKIISIWCLSVQFGRRSMKFIREDCRALMFSLIYPWTNGRVNASGLRCHCTYYDVTVMTNGYSFTDDIFKCMFCFVFSEREVLYFVSNLSTFIRALLIINKHWFRWWLGTKQVPHHLP